MQGVDGAPRRVGCDRMDRFLCGLAAGMVAKLGTHPLDVAKKRFQVCRAESSVEGAWRVLDCIRCQVIRQCTLKRSQDVLPGVHRAGWMLMHLASL